MSWSGFKKNVGRATTQVMMKTGHVEKTSDREYEVEERRYRTLESASLRLQKEAKGYLDSLRAMTASQMRIAETIDAFYGDSGARDGVSRSYKQAVEDLDAETVKALDGPYRCVSQEPGMKDLIRLDLEKEGYGEETLKEIEAELNFKAGNKRNYTKSMRQGDIVKHELIEFVYRTTVLEPINRFCAYFPDINECIKKRNHKMLDYDAMRSKVKKLVEKPDKDPAKLPRTEKETEMVMDASTFLRPSMLHNDTPPLLGKTEKACDDEGYLMTSPPKALDGLKNRRKKKSEDWGLKIEDDEDAALRSVGGSGLKRSSAFLKQAKRVSSVLSSALLGDTSTTSSAESPSYFTGAGEGDRLLPVQSLSPEQSIVSLVSYKTANSSLALPETSTEALLAEIRKRTSYASVHPYDRKPLSAQQNSSCSPMRHCSQPANETISKVTTSKNSRTTRKSTGSNLDGRTSMDNPFQPGIPRTHAKTPFFNPSELEAAMAPLMLEYIEKQADLLDQAKAAYDQLNQQLTDELPQLIDLRVPYLDPSFEALVKIQLRFCAEAYSRMAQVQQYLDASTRDQYASGDLDARVEDVLGQIRELSIAGTV